MVVIPWFLYPPDGTYVVGPPSRGLQEARRCVFHAPCPTVPTKNMAATQRAGKRPQKSSSNGRTATVPPEQGAGLWKLFPALMVFVGIVVGILWEQPATDGVMGEAKAPSSKGDGEMYCSQASSAFLQCLSLFSHRSVCECSLLTGVRFETKVHGRTG